MKVVCAVSTLQALAHTPAQTQKYSNSAPEVLNNERILQPLRIVYSTYYIKIPLAPTNVKPGEFIATRADD